MFSDHFYPTPLPELLQIILNQYKKYKRIFGIPESLFFRPQNSDVFRSERFGQILETPIGVAAGPHTQLSQNIIAAWLTGARFIELKTIQTLDELRVSKPCIDMQDEGYNCEWSQELKVRQSFDQYLDAWILIHILKHELGIGSEIERGFIFNMSVGYDLKGIQQDNVQWFLANMQDASAELQQKKEQIRAIYPKINELKISPEISDNVTLSTMHGCPPVEIEQIGYYLLAEKRLHTSIKLNPTLVGKENLYQILGNSGFATQVPIQAFQHDLKYDDALQIISRLYETAVINDLHFGVKLTNTLESVNNRRVFPPHEKMMYMSGRALHPVSVAIAYRLQKDFSGKLDISFCGGAHAFNVAALLACGLSPVTVCSDLLRPGGYGRLRQYTDEIKQDFNALNANNIQEFILAKSGKNYQKIYKAALTNLEQYAKDVLVDNQYKKTGFLEQDIKTLRSLAWFDCIHAPCEDTCPTHQDIPLYNYHTAAGNFAKAAEVIRQTNPFPRTTGMICDHLCQLKCTRINYDDAVCIREIKRFVAERVAAEDHIANRDIAFGLTNKKVAIIGAGPSGLSCASFLAKAGFKAEVFETKPQSGGMISSGIPSFRLTDEALLSDIGAINKMGVKIHHNIEIDKLKFNELRESHDYIYVAVGAQRSAKINIKGIQSNGIIDPLIFLENQKNNRNVPLGNQVIIIGGGNTAMDVARTAFRVVGEEGKVIVIYRRTIREMPADKSEIQAVLDEGIKIMQLVAPIRVNTANGKVVSLSCVRMELSQVDESGRPRPVPIPGSEFEIRADTIIPAVGQELAIDFCDLNLLRTKPGSYETRIPNVFIGGDAWRGASTAINAIGDGRKAAQEIIDREKILFETKPDNKRISLEMNHHMGMRSKRMKPVQTSETSLEDRKNFNLVSSTISESQAVYEASRCLLCDEVCNICVTVCPNLAFHSFEVEPKTYNLQKLVHQAGQWQVAQDKPFTINQLHQILHIADWCNHCGNCNTFCPSAGAPYKIKPHLFLSRNAFENKNDGFWFEPKKGNQTLHYRLDGKEYRLTTFPDHMLFELDETRITLNINNLSILNFEVGSSQPGEISLETATKMFIILQGARSFKLAE